MPFIIFLIALFAVWKLGLLNDVDYHTTPFERRTCADVADAVRGEAVSSLGWEEYVIEGVRDVERVSKTATRIECTATVVLDDGSRRAVRLVGRQGARGITVVSR